MQYLSRNILTHTGNNFQSRNSLFEIKLFEGTGHLTLCHAKPGAELVRKPGPTMWVWVCSWVPTQVMDRDFFHQKMTGVPWGKKKARILYNSKDKDSERRNKRIRSVPGEALCQKVSLQIQKSYVFQGLPQILSLKSCNNQEILFPK